MSHRLTLDYTLPKGWLAPYFDALAEGRACASACAVCSAVRFPPDPACAGRHPGAVRWVDLPGTATILRRTTTGDGAAFALVRFDGADNAATVRLESSGEGARVRLLPAGGEAPGLRVRIWEED